MATTGVNIVQYLVACLVSATVQAANALGILNPTSAKQLEAEGKVTRLDYVNIDLSTAGYAKNGGQQVSLTGTTPVTVSLLDLTSNATSYSGDTVFATWNQLVFKNLGNADLTIASAASNGASLGLTGTTPALTVPANSSVTLQSVAGIAVTSSAKSITVTPTSGGSFAMCVGGA